MFPVWCWRGLSITRSSIAMCQDSSKWWNTDASGFFAILQKWKVEFRKRELATGEKSNTLTAIAYPISRNSVSFQKIDFCPTLFCNCTISGPIKLQAQLTRNSRGVNDLFVSWQATFSFRQRISTADMACIRWRCLGNTTQLSCSGFANGTAIQNFSAGYANSCNVSVEVRLAAAGPDAIPASAFLNVNLNEEPKGGWNVVFQRSSSYWAVFVGANVCLAKYLVLVVWDKEAAEMPF